MAARGGRAVSMAALLGVGGQGSDVRDDVCRRGVAASGGVDVSTTGIHPRLRGTSGRTGPRPAARAVVDAALMEPPVPAAPPPPPHAAVVLFVETTRAASRGNELLAGNYTTTLHVFTDENVESSLRGARTAPLRTAG